jgi:hypothetical protein
LGDADTAQAAYRGASIRRISIRLAGLGVFDIGETMGTWAMRTVGKT